MEPSSATMSRLPHRFYFHSVLLMDFVSSAIWMPGLRWCDSCACATGITSTQHTERVVNVVKAAHMCLRSHLPLTCRGTFITENISRSRDPACQRILTFWLYYHSKDAMSVQWFLRVWGTTFYIPDLFFYQQTQTLVLTLSITNILMLALTLLLIYTELTMLTDQEKKGFLC